MNKNLITCLLLLFIIFGCNTKSDKLLAPHTNTDSLTVFFERANDGSLKFKERYQYNKSALNIISKNKNDSLNRVQYFKIANRYFNMSAMHDYKIISLLLIKNSISANDSLSLGKAYNYVGDYYSNKFISDSAYRYYLKAEKVYKFLKDNTNTAKALLNKAVLQFNEGDYVGSESSAFQSLKYLRNSDNDEMAYEANNVLGIIYSDLEEIDKSIEYHSKALAIADKKSIYPEYQAISTSLNNLGYLYKNLKKYNDAIVYFKKGLLEKDVYRDKPSLYANLKDNLAYSEFKTGNLKQIPSLFYEALKIRDSLNIIPGIIGSKLNLSEYYAYKKDTTKSLSFANQAYQLAKKSNRPKDVLLTLKQLSAVQPSKKGQYSDQYIRINDSLQLAERKIRNKLARIEFETDELALEKNQLVEQRKTLIYIALAIILLGVFIFVIRFQAAKNRELLLVQEQQKANEEIYQLMLSQQNKVEEVRQLEKKRIAQEIHDGVLGKLFGTRMNLGVLNARKDDDSISERVGYIDELKNLEQELREISHDLNSEKTAVFNNFVLMVTNFIATQKNVCQAVIKLDLDPEIQWNQVDNISKINLYRILQEAFQNINKYAGAQNVAVTFAKSGGLIQLSIQDDGAGFNFARKKKGIGLLNMDSRITASGGKMEVETAPGKGTILKFELAPNTNIINLPPHEKNFTSINGR